jgi:hypothetical protein
VATYVRTEQGELLGQSLVDEQGRMTVYDVPRARTSTVSFAQRAPISAAGGLIDVLDAPLPIGIAQPIRQEQRADHPVIVLERRGPADAQWRHLVASGAIKQPYARDLAIAERGQRFVFARDTQQLLLVAEFVVAPDGTEQVLRSQEWQRVEVFDQAQAPAGILTPTLPVIADRLTAVPLRQLTLDEAARTLPFTLYTLALAPGAVETPLVSYTTGQQVPLTTLPAHYRGLDFAVQRGEAARIVYDRSARYLDLVQGPSTNFAAALRQAPAFWASAQSITVQVGQASVAGWSLGSAPNTITTDPQAGSVQQIPGPRWVLLPDIGGTGILLTAQGYSEAELLAIAAQLRPAP